MPQTNAERQESLVTRRKKAGLVMLRNFWVAPSEAAQIKRYASRMPETQARRERARVKR